MNDVLSASAMSRREPLPGYKLLTRHNGLVFYGLAAASFLETAIPMHARVLVNVFSGEPDTRRWIEENWWRTKYGHGIEARTYIEATWPEFDWAGAYAAFETAYRPLVGAHREADCAAAKALACGVAAAQASAFYRALGAAADDPELRSRLYRMGDGEAAHFTRFRELFSRMERTKHMGLLATYRTIVACARRARDVHVRLAHARLGASYWYGSVPFPEIDYAEFVQRMGRVVRRHVSLDPAQRLLFRAWWQARELQSATRPVVPQARNFAGRHSISARLSP